MPRPSARKGSRGAPPGAPRDDGAVAWRDGVQLAGSVVWCDAGRARDLCFISHAHLRTRGAHRKLLTTSRTLALLAAAGHAPAGEVLVSPFGRPFTLGALRLELFPSGHLPGAASLLLTDDKGRRIVYAGDVNPARALGETSEVRGAEVLVLEAPLAPVAGVLPPREQALEQLVSLVADAGRSGRPVIVLGPALGAAQEAALVLARAGAVVRAHRSICDYAAAYASLDLPAAAPLPFRNRLAGGEALLWPLELRDSPVLRRFPSALRVALTGLALDENAPALLGVDRALPLSDHADLDALLRYVEHTEARRVYVTVGHCERLTAALAARRIEALPLGPPRQMELFG